MSLEWIIVGSKNYQEIVEAIRPFRPNATFVDCETADEMLETAIKSQVDGIKYNVLITDYDFTDGKERGWEVLAAYKNLVTGPRIMLIDEVSKFNKDGAKKHKLGKGTMYVHERNDFLKNKAQRLKPKTKQKAKPKEPKLVMVEMFRNVEVDTTKYLVLVSTSEGGPSLSVNQVGQLMSNNGIDATVTSDIGIESLRKRIGLEDYDKVLVYGNFDTNGFVRDATDNLQKAGYSRQVLQAKGLKDFSDAMKVLKGSQ